MNKTRSNKKISFYEDITVYYATFCKDKSTFLVSAVDNLYF